MHLQEQYYLYDFTKYLIKNEGYQLAHFNTKKNEIWLVKSKWRSTKIIRLIQRGFDWRNHLKTDIALLFQQVRNLRRQIGGKNIQIHNVYISSLEPVDDWEKLKEPLQLKERNPLKMKVYYMTAENRETEQRRLLKEIKASSNYMVQITDTENQESAVQQYQYELGRAIYEKNKRIKDVFSFGKPRFAYLLIYINVIIFLLIEINGGSTNIDNLIQFGAKYNPAIIDGEWWRIMTSMFLHIGIFHLIMNMIALYYLGTVVERIFGSLRFVYIYFLAGIAGGMTSFTFNISISAGASGAIFGLFGALLFFGTMYRDLFKQTMGKNLILILLINLVFGFMIPQIDMGAHVGGLIGGYIASAIVFVPQQRRLLVQIVALIVYFALIILLGYLGITINLQLFN